MKYEPLFDFGEPISPGRLHVVIPGDFVTTSAGTGIVHTEAGEFAGRFCKDADREIIRDLKARGLLFAEST